MTSAWRDRAHDIATLIALFGAPAQLAPVLTLERRVRDLMRDWLRLIETLVRRTLLVDALALVRAGLKPRQIRVRSKAEPAPPLMEGDDPSAWRVSLRLRVVTPQNPAAHVNWRVPGHPFDARPLAKRLEALIRIVAAPAARAIRLARRLARFGGRTLAARMLRTPKSAADPQGWMFRGDEGALAPAYAFVNSS